MPKIDLSCGNRLEVLPFVTESKYLAMSKLVEDSLVGGFAGEAAAVKLKETLSTSDAPWSLAQLINVRNLPEYDAADRQWNKIAAVETVDDFSETSFERFVPNFDNLKYGKDTKGNPGVSPLVPELDTYVYAFGYAEEAVRAKLEKRGFKFGLSLERIISKLRPTVRNLPGQMLDVALDTDEFLVFDALQSGVTTATDLSTGTYLPTGATVAANAPFSAEALALGFSQVAQRTDTLTNRKVTLASQYYIVVQAGQEEMVNVELEKARNGITLQDGSIVRRFPTNSALGRVAGVIGSEWITDSDAWYAVPAAGTTRRPGLVKLQLSGRTAPEVLVNNFTGVPIGGSRGGDPFALAHFDNDSVDLKLRQFTNSALITEQQIVWSNGSGS